MSIKEDLLLKHAFFVALGMSNYRDGQIIFHKLETEHIRIATRRFNYLEGLRVQDTMKLNYVSEASDPLKFINISRASELRELKNVKTYGSWEGLQDILKLNHVSKASDPVKNFEKKNYFLVTSF